MKKKGGDQGCQWSILAPEFDLRAQMPDGSTSAEEIRLARNLSQAEEVSTTVKRWAEISENPFNGGTD